MKAARLIFALPRQALMRIRFVLPSCEILNFTRILLCGSRLDDPRNNISLLLEAYALIADGIRSRLRLVLAGFAGPLDNF